MELNLPDDGPFARTETKNHRPPRLVVVSVVEEFVKKKQTQADRAVPKNALFYAVVQRQRRAKKSFSHLNRTRPDQLCRAGTPYLRGEQVVILIVHRKSSVSSQLCSFGTGSSRFCHAVVEVFSQSV